MKIKLLIFGLLLGTSITAYSQSARSESSRSKATASSSARVAERVYARSSGDVYVDAGSLSEKQTSLMLSKSFSGESVEASTEFSIDKSQKRISMRTMGRCVVGEIKITILKPNGGVFQDLVINPTADVNWSTSFSIDQMEASSEYYGNWTLKVKATKVEGNYNLNISAK